MRRFIIIGLVGAFLASSSTALAHNTKWALPTWKAKQMVVREASVQVPADQKGPLARELRESVRLYRALLLATSHAADSEIQAVYQGLLNRYQAALRSVEGGLAIQAASCRGTGQAVQRVRYRHFGCTVTSGVLEIPVATLDYGARDLPLVIEGPPRVVGPYQSTLDVHVTGKTSIAYGQAE